MKDKLKRLLLAVRKKTARPGGIGLALWYAKSIDDIVPDQKAAERFFGPGGMFTFKQSLKEAGRKLVFRNKDMVVLGGRWASKADSLFKDVSERAVKSFAKAVKEAKGGGDLKACMHFEAVYTSQKRDRDGDVLEPKGAEIDQGMPLLWQHNAAQPIGRHLAVTGKDEKHIKGHCAIADTELGRDAAVLVEFGALRISHGFAPKEYEPLSEEESKGRPGWHVKSYEMMEVSLVSIPSNTDAVITAFGRGKLHCPLMKRWAKRLDDVRSTMAKGGFDKNGRNKPKGGTGSGGTGGDSGSSSRVTLNLNLDGGLKGLLESLEKKAGKKGKTHVAKDDEDDGEAEDKADDEDEGGGTLLEQVRQQLQALAASGELSDETLAKVNAMVITVSEAIGAERAGGGADAEPAEEVDFGEAGDEEEEDGKDDDEEEEDEDEEEKDDDEAEDKDDEDETEDKDDDEDEEEEEEDEPGKGEDNPDDLDGEDTDDPSVSGKPPKSFATADDAASYLSLMLSAGTKVKKARLEQLLDDVSKALASA